ncbi:MAG: 16S rRNA (uracil(1498)-N(3))-methyltransferase [Thermodesulfovibrionales bacterium]|nr:16S rRNA (uracil(1498)-N(3))-methyltransferase [Thermodesulfovibrionales bacterium]
MARLIIPTNEISSGKEIRISGQDAHYLINVLRLNKGEGFQILDGRGKLHTAEIISTKKKEVVARIISTEKSSTESSLFLVLVQAILKSEKMDLVIQKATELGVKEIYPVITSRTIVRSTEKHKRWLRIAQESVRQCGRTEIPVVHEPVLFEEFFKQFDRSERHRGFIFYEGAERGLKEFAVKTCYEGREQQFKLFCITGPEGGFSEKEVELAISYGFIPAGLGPRILRAETASIVALSLMQFVYGDLG